MQRLGYLSDTANNFALFRREMLAAHRWTEPLKLREHADFYWRVKQAGQRQVAICEQVRCKHLRVQSPEYKEHRHRNHEFLNTMLDLSGLKELNILPGGDPRMAVNGRPNIVVLGVSNSGTTIVTKMLHALGWQAADADETFAESVRPRGINESRDFSGAAEYVAGLPQPCAIKDPRLVRTLGRWQPFLVPYKPLLLWVIRDRESVLESKRKRGVVSVTFSPDGKSLASKSSLGIVRLWDMRTKKEETVSELSQFSLPLGGEIEVVFQGFDQFCDVALFV